jgi:hypothetical protein
VGRVQTTANIKMNTFVYAFGWLTLVVLSQASTDRDYAVSVMMKIAGPVMTSQAQGKLNISLPKHSWEKDRLPFAPLEAFGRTLAGLAPWIELPSMDSSESQLRSKFAEVTRQALVQSTNSSSTGFLNWNQAGTQPIVDAAFVALGLLRAPTQLWGKLNSAEQENVLKSLKLTRSIHCCGENNWYLFPATIEAAIWKYEGDRDCLVDKIQTAVEKMLKWYVGDGTYGDGAHFHWDYYNSYVIQPMLLEVLEVARGKNHSVAQYLPLVLKRSVRYAEVQERMISPEGTYPVIGRSSTYRFGAFHLLATMALKKQLSSELQPEVVRSALNAVVRRQIEFPGTFDGEGWLQVGAVGHQPSIRESYISSGSVYLATFGLVHLGLPETDPLWTAAPGNWTQKRIWSGQDIKADHALD